MPARFKAPAPEGRLSWLMILGRERTRVRKVMAEEGLDEVRFRFDFEGTKVII